MQKALGSKDAIVRYEAHKDASARVGSLVKPRIILSGHSEKSQKSEGST